MCAILAAKMAHILAVDAKMCAVNAHMLAFTAEVVLKIFKLSLNI